MDAAFKQHCADLHAVYLHRKACERHAVELEAALRRLVERWPETPRYLVGEARTLLHQIETEKTAPRAQNEEDVP